MKTLIRMTAQRAAVMLNMRDYLSVNMSGVIGAGCWPRFCGSVEAAGRQMRHLAAAGALERVCRGEYTRGPRWNDGVKAAEAFLKESA